MTPTTNVSNLSTAGGRPASMIEGLVAFVSRSKVKATLRKEKEKASASVICLDLKLPYAIETVEELYSIRIMAPQFQKFNARRAKHESMSCASLITWEHILVTRTYC